MPNVYPAGSNIQLQYGDQGILAVNPGFEYQDQTPTNPVYFEDRLINGVMYRVQNATWSKFANSWSLINPALPAYATSFNNGVASGLTSPANVSPFTTWTPLTSGTVRGTTTLFAVGTTNGTLSSFISVPQVAANSVIAYNQIGDPGVTFSLSFAFTPGSGFYATIRCSGTTTGPITINWVLL